MCYTYVYMAIHPLLSSAFLRTPPIQLPLYVVNEYGLMSSGI